MCRFFVIFKAFNISVFDISPNNEDLFWLTPSDIETQEFNLFKSGIRLHAFVYYSTITKSVPVILITTISSTLQQVSNIDCKCTDLEYGPSS
jgi:hypothetical protein